MQVADTLSMQIKVSGNNFTDIFLRLRDLCFTISTIIKGFNMCVEIKIDDSKKIDVPLKKDVSADARELENVLPELKQALVGKKLKYIVNKSIWHTEFTSDCPVMFDNYRKVYFEDFGFVFDNQFLKIKIYGSYQYDVSLNSHNYLNLFSTKDVNITEWKPGYNDTNVYNDISHIFDFMIDSELEDISLVVDSYEDDYDLEKFIMYFSGGRRIIIANQEDNPSITIK